MQKYVGTAFCWGYKVLVIIYNCLLRDKLSYTTSKLLSSAKQIIIINA